MAGKVFLHYNLMEPLVLTGLPSGRSYQFFGTDGRRGTLYAVDDIGDDRDGRRDIDFLLRVIRSVRRGCCKDARAMQAFTPATPIDGEEAQEPRQV